MKTKNVLLISIVIIASAIVIQSCKKKEDDAPVSNEFVANDNTFKNFNTWTQINTVVGFDPNVGANFHGGVITDMTRLGYLKNDQDTIKGEVYPKGTLLVMYSYNNDKSYKEYVGMAKRAGNFNAGQNGWEWFVLNSNGSIAVNDTTGDKLRGDYLMNNACGSCHVKAKIDFVHSKYK
jgi:hypothetical protein